jgi:hypothetical protein
MVRPKYTQIHAPALAKICVPKCMPISEAKKITLMKLIKVPCIRSFRKNKKSNLTLEREKLSTKPAGEREILNASRIKYDKSTLLKAAQMRRGGMNYEQIGAFLNIPITSYFKQLVPKHVYRLEQAEMSKEDDDLLED